MQEGCKGTHRFFVAETGLAEEEGKICVVIVCTACGEGKLIEHVIDGKLRLLNKKEK